jgi:nitrogen fixation protein FixH
MPALPLRPHHIPWLFVAGFGVVIAVNSVMIWLAIGSFSGLYSGHARERGLHYNRVVAEQRSRDALHWQIDTTWQPELGRLQLEITGADGRPLQDARASAELVRPAEKRPPLPVVLRELGDGKFAARVDLPARGNWDLDIVVDAQGQHFAVTKRMFLR